MSVVPKVLIARSRRRDRARLRGKTRKSFLRERPIAILPGQYFDAETGLHQNWHRDYDPSIGRYLQSDPVGLGGGLSTYGYALQNPVVYYDPEGKTAAHAMRAAGQLGYFAGRRAIAPAIDYAVYGLTGSATLGILLYDITHPGEDDVIEDAPPAANDADANACPDDPSECELRHNSLLIEQIKIIEDARGAPPGANEIRFYGNLRARKKAWNEAVDQYNRRCPKKIGFRFQDV